MPCAVTAFTVKIDSPGDAGMESIIAREVIYQWNASHSLEQKRVLIPLGNTGAPANKNSSGDLLVAFFCASQGVPDEFSSQAVEGEIEKQIEAGRPVLIYFSEGRVDFGGVAVHRTRALDQFKKRFESHAVIDSFGDEKEFRAKFTRQLDTTIRTHAYFKGVAPACSAATQAGSAISSSTRELSKLARELLIEACEDFEAYIGWFKDDRTLKIQANGKQLVEQGNPKAAAMWESAFGELLTGGFIRDAGCNGQLFQISPKGFDFLKSIGKTPVGYIAELGGM